MADVERVKINCVGQGVVEIQIPFQRAQSHAGQRLHFFVVGGFFFPDARPHHRVGLGAHDFYQFDPPPALHEHREGFVGQVVRQADRAFHADGVKVAPGGVVFGGVAQEEDGHRMAALRGCPNGRDVFFAAQNHRA